MPFRIHHIFLSSFILLLLCGPVQAEIYKWTDKEGNVHFGDKPAGGEAAESAQPITVQENYQPPERSEEEIDAIEAQKAVRREADRLRSEQDDKSRAAELAERKERKATLCAAIAEDLNTFDASHWDKGMRVVNYIEGEDGKSISAEEQRQYIAELKERWKAEGC